MGHLANEEFFTKLGELFDSRKGKYHGAIYLTQKRLTYGQQLDTTTPDTDLSPPQPLPVLIRATDGKGKDKTKLKLSTVVEPAALDGFYGRYAELCKVGMTALKPRDRSKKRAKAKKRKGGGGAAVGAS